MDHNVGVDVSSLHFDWGPGLAFQISILVTMLLVLLCLMVLLPLTQQHEITGVFKIESPSGDPVSEMRVYLTDPSSSSSVSSATTDANGMANLTGFLPGQQFIVQALKPPFYQPLFIFGIAPQGSESFQYTTFIGTRTEVTSSLCILSLKLIVFMSTSSN